MGTVCESCGRWDDDVTANYTTTTTAHKPSRNFPEVENERGL